MSDTNNSNKNHVTDTKPFSSTPIATNGSSVVIGEALRSGSYEAEWGLIPFKGDAKGVADELRTLGDMNGGGFNTKQMVDYARNNQDSELHKCFEWDDTIAAERYRIHQASNIIHHLKITVVDSYGKKEKTKVTVFIKKDEAKNTPYQMTEVVVKTPDKYQSLLNKAMQELRSFQQRYSWIAELQNVFTAIDAVKVP